MPKGKKKRQQVMVTTRVEGSKKVKRVKMSPKDAIKYVGEQAKKHG